MARLRYHWRFRRAFSNKLSPTGKIIAIFYVFLNKNNYAIARWRYYCRFHRALSNKMSPYSENYCDFQRFLLFRNKARNLVKMRGCGKWAKMRDFPHDCGTVDTCALYMFFVYMEAKIFDGSKRKRATLHILTWNPPESELPIIDENWE